MIGHAGLREVVGADALGTIHGADLGRATFSGLSGHFLFLHDLQPSCEHLHGARLVLDLGTLLLTRHHHARGQVGDAHGGVSGVHALSTLTGGTVDIDAQILVIDLHVFHLIRLWVDQHASRGGLNAALGFRHGNALHAVHAALELELGPRAIT